MGFLASRRPRPPSRIGRGRVTTCSLAVLILAVALGPQAEATHRPRIISISFDERFAPVFFARTVALRDLYAPIGVRFHGADNNDGGAILDEDDDWGVTGYSYPNILAFNRGGVMRDGGVPQPPEVVIFDVPVSHFEIKAEGSFGNQVCVFLRAFDSSGRLVARGAIITDGTLRPVSVDGEMIAKVFIVSDADSLVLDDLVAW